MTTISSIPDEVLEFILLHISPYEDLHSCLLVSKRWKRCVRNVVKLRKRNFKKSIAEFNVKWFSLSIACSENYMKTPTISKRYSHAAVVHENFMYVFGGCSHSMTTFNDLWKFDLSQRIWLRPFATGNYPSPKAHTSLTCYKDQLILFGGWTYPSNTIYLDFYSKWFVFDELHMYDIKSSHWNQIVTQFNPPPTAGHSVSIINDDMIIFGGLIKEGTNQLQCQRTNEVWKFNLELLTWTKPVIKSRKPKARCGQTQINLDDKNILIIGGSDDPQSSLSDAWILRIDEVWTWIPVEVRAKSNRPPDLWTNLGCKVGDKVVFVNKIEDNLPKLPCQLPESTENISTEDPPLNARIDLAKRPPDVDENINGKRGSLKVLRTNKNSPDKSQLRDLKINVRNPDHMAMAAFIKNTNDSDRVNNLERIHQRMLRDKKLLPKSQLLNQNLTRSGLYVLDISHALDDKPYVTWLPPRNLQKGPETKILFTLCLGKSEIIMFGGVKDLNEGKNFYSTVNISNDLHFISAQKYVI